MVPSIARQSVIIKCNAQKSVLLGNYEFYYAAGLLKSLLDLKLSEETKPKELLEELLAQLEGRTAGDKRAQYLIGMVEDYDASPDYDGQMQELFRWGETEQDMWEVGTERTTS